MRPPPAEISPSPGNIFRPLAEIGPNSEVAQCEHGRPAPARGSPARFGLTPADEAISAKTITAHFTVDPPTAMPHPKRTGGPRAAPLARPASEFGFGAIYLTQLGAPVTPSAACLRGRYHNLLGQVE